VGLPHMQGAPRGEAMTNLHPTNTPDEQPENAPAAAIGPEDLGAQDVIEPAPPTEENLLEGYRTDAPIGMEDEQPVGQEPQQPGTAVITGNRTTRSESVEGMTGEIVTPSMTDEAQEQTVAEVQRALRAERFEDAVRGAPGWPRSDRGQTEAA